MSYAAFKTLYWRMPYEIRSALFRVWDPKQYRRLKQLRTDLPERTDLPTFKPFLDNVCLFVHIPKAAGLSVGHSLFGRRTGNHTAITRYQIAFSRQEFNRLFKFTFVRNPWDRLLSAYLFLKDGGQNEVDRRWGRQHLSRYESFDHFVLDGVRERCITEWLHFIPQYKFVTIPGRANPCVDFIGLFENLQDDYRHIRRVLGIGKDLGFQNKTRSRSRDYRSYYTDEMIDVVGDVYRRDVELFGYDFDNSTLPEQLSRRAESTGATMRRVA